MTSYNDPDNDVYFEYISMKNQQLEELESQMAPIRAEVEIANKALAEEASKSKTQAWKRKEPLKIETEASKEAKSRLSENTARLGTFEEKAKALKSCINEIQKIVDENEEYYAWAQNLKLPLSQRQNLPYPVRIQRQDAREALEREESMKQEEWASLTLDHQSPKGKDARDRFLIGLNNPGDIGVVIDKPVEEKVESVVVTPLPETPTLRTKLPWWYKKYNIPLTA